MSTVTLTKDKYKQVIKDDIKLVKKYIPKEHLLRTHIIAVLNCSVNQLYPPEYRNKKTNKVFPEFPDEKPGYPSRRNAELP